MNKILLFIGTIALIILLQQPKVVLSTEGTIQIEQAEQLYQQARYLGAIAPIKDCD